jgi:hypothetical protein
MRSSFLCKLKMKVEVNHQTGHNRPEEEDDHVPEELLPVLRDLFFDERSRSDGARADLADLRGCC